MENSKYQYNPWPLGKVPVEFQRDELQRIKDAGYAWSDARDVIDIFENKIADYAGSKYAVLCDCCSHGIFLSLKYLHHTGELTKGMWTDITIPSRTYVSAPMQIKHAGNSVKFEDVEWSGIYQLKPTRIWDGAVRWTKNMYVGDDALQVLSFQFKKRVPIGKGGAIITDDKNAYEWLKLAVYDGRDMTLPYDHPDHVKMNGYHMYMTPEDAARGILLMDRVPEINDDSGSHLNYTDVSKIKIS